jgi:hypothetical protein
MATTSTYQARTSAEWERMCDVRAKHLGICRTWISAFWGAMAGAAAAVLEGSSLLTPAFTSTILRK